MAPIPDPTQLTEPTYILMSWYATAAVKNDVQNLKADDAAKGIPITII